MYRIALINMPFASVGLPSIALTQLKSVTLDRLEGRVEVEDFYLNLDFAEALGIEVYRAIGDSVDAVTSGLGDWYFRHVAFPDLEDNTEAYLTRHFAGRKAFDQIRAPFLASRQQAETLLDQLIDRYRLDTFDLVGLTSMFSQNVACFAMAKKLKARNPDVITVMGGANCETPMGQVIVRNVEWIDYVASGPSLTTFPDLAQALVDGNEDNSHSIRGMFSKKKLEAAEGPLHEAGQELDIDTEVPLDFDPFLDHLDRAFSDESLEIKLPFETSRGCWWGERSHCTFCGLNGMTMQYRSMAPDKARILLEDLFERYGSRVQRFQSVDNILPREYLTDLLPKLEPPEGTSIFYEVKADLKVREMEALARAKINQIQPGIEALATSTLKLMGKGTTSFQNLEFLKSCLRFDIEPHWNLLLGFPGEEEEIYKKYFADLPLLVHLPPPGGAYPVRFDRYSPYFTKADHYGLDLKAADFYGMIYPFPEEDLEEMAYYFADQNFEAPYLVRTARWLGKLRQRIDYWHSRWWQTDRGLAPKLEFLQKGDKRVIVDTRSGIEVTHDLGPIPMEALGHLARPLKLSRLAARMDTDANESQIRRLLTALMGRGLVFQDRDLYYSLVVNPEPVEDGAWMAGKATGAREGASPAATAG